MQLACIGIGSNAIRLLVADWVDDGLRVLRRERRGTRLFAGLVNGRLTEQSMRASVEAVAELAFIARADGVAEISVFATSATRDAANGADFVRMAEQASGTKIEIISGEQEAVLSYMGASEGGRGGVIDIGGGSTEFTLGEDDQILGAISLQMGAVRMNGLHPILSEADYEQTVQDCVNLIERDAAHLLALPRPKRWVGVGGTMTTLGAMQKHLPLFETTRCEGMCVTHENVTAWGKKLAQMPPAMRVQVVGLMPQRADIIPSGMAILDAAMQVFGMKEIALSAHGNMDGFLKKKFKKMY